MPILTKHTMRLIGRTVLPVTLVLALASVVLTGASGPIVIWELIVIWHSWAVANYWLNRAEGNRAEYFSVVVSDQWEGDPDEADLAMLVPTIVGAVFPFAWVFV